MKQIRKIILLSFSLLFLWGCQNGDDELPPTLAPTVSITEGVIEPTAVLATAVPTPIPPTPTPSEPLAAIVNGEEILLATYEKQLARFQQSDPDSSIDYKPVALNSIIDNVLITQAAIAAGFTVDEARIDQEIVSLIEAAEGRENFEAWLSRNFYTEEELRQEVAFGILYGPLVADVAASVSTNSEQVRASYIKVDDEALANTILTQLQNGEPFSTLANQYSIPEQNKQTQTGGDIGFFGLDWPLQNVPPELQQVAFNLDIGQTSQLPPQVESDGVTYYYLVQTSQRDPQHPIPQPKLDQLRQDAILSWTESLRQNADIVILVDLGS